MSLVHFIPDTSCVPCLGCNELVASRDLVKHTMHSGKSTFFWHPYHLWCIRPRPPMPNLGHSCAEWGEALDLDDMRAIVTWGATAERRLERRMLGATFGAAEVLEDPAAFVPRPGALRLVAVDHRGVRDPNAGTRGVPLVNG